MMIEVKELVKNYSNNTVQVLKGINFKARNQDFIAIMGKSGCGKTTFLKTLGMIDKPNSGSVFFQGMDIEELWKEEVADIRRRSIGFVFQDFFLMESLTAEENIMLPMILDKQKPDCMKETVKNKAEHFEISHLLEKYPHQLSGGEKQRVAICRALINNPDLILADEPTGNLDSKSGKKVIETLENINEKMGKTIIMVTHDVEIASHCRRVVFLKDGQIIRSMEKNGEKNEFYMELLSYMNEL